VQAVKAYLLQHGYAGSEHTHTRTAATLIRSSRWCRSILRRHGRCEYDRAYPYIVPMMVPGRLKHSSDTVASVEGWIDAAVTNNEWLLLCFHSIVPSVTVQATDCLLADFQSIITYIAGKGCAVLPVSRALAALHP